MYPTRLGLVETGVGYTETACIVRRDWENFCTAIKKYHDLFMQSGYQAAAVDTWGGLHFLPLIMTVFLFHYEKNSFVNQLDSGMFGFDDCKGTALFDDQMDVKSVASTDLYQAFVIAPIVKGRFWYVGVGLVFKPATIGAGHIAKCKMFLNSFFSLCGNLPDMHLLNRKSRILNAHPCKTLTAKASEDHNSEVCYSSSNIKVKLQRLRFICTGKLYHPCKNNMIGTWTYHK